MYRCPVETPAPVTDPVVRACAATCVVSTVNANSWPSA